MSTVISRGEHRAVLRSVRWETYLALVEDSQTTGGKMTYDQGILEIMTPSMPHEGAGALLGRLIESFTLVRDIEIRSVASTTFKRSDQRRGFEADESYYIQHAPDIRGLREVDLSIHPPPDLVVEIEITHSAIDKQQLFASMGIREYWRYDEQELIVSILREGSYEQVRKSAVLPDFPISLAEEILSMQFDSNETALVKRFVQQVSI